MLAYWLLFLFPMFAALLGADRGPREGAHLRRLTPAWIVYWLMLVLLIGLRDRVGGDWYNYLGNLQDVKDQPFSALILQSDPGYKILSWLSLQFGWGIFGVNVICALVFATGLVVFCRSLPRPWLAATVAVPYLVVVVSMGYSRQGIALGFALLGLTALGRHRIKTFAGWIVAGATFHRSALLLLPIAALTAARRRIWVVFWIGMLGVVGYLSLIEQDVENLYTNYIARGYESQGALVRLAMNAFAAILLLLLRKRLRMTPAMWALWRWMSLLALALFAAYFVASGASTALDRLGLYLLPLQLVTFTYLPGAVSRKSPKPLVLAVAGGYAAALFVWLNYAANAYAWLPYRIYLFGD